MNDNGNNGEVWISFSMHERIISMHELLKLQDEYHRNAVEMNEEFVMETCGLKCGLCPCRGHDCYYIGTGCPIYAEAVVQSLNR